MDYTTTNNTTPPTWKITCLKRGLHRGEFESFDMHGDNRRGPGRTSSLLRSGLIENIGRYPSGAAKYQITRKGLELL